MFCVASKPFGLLGSLIKNYYPVWKGPKNSYKSTPEKGGIEPKYAIWEGTGFATGQ